MRKTVMVNLLSLLWGLWRRRYLIVVPIILMPIIGLAIGILSPKKYQTTTTILIQEAANQNPFLEDLTVETKLKERMAALRALLHSRHILGPVGMQTGIITKDMSPETVSRRITDFSAKLRVNLIGDDLVKLTYTSNRPDKMADVLHKVSLRFVERIIAPQRSSISSSENFLDTEIKARREKLVEAERKLGEYKSKHASELPELHSNNVRRLQHLDEMLAERRSQLEGAKGELDELQNRLASTNPVVGRLEEKIVEVRGSLAMLRARYTDQHSKVQTALRHLQSLENERATALRTAKPVLADDLDRLWNMAATARTSSNGEFVQGQPLLISQLERLQTAKNRVTSLTEEVTSLTSERDSLSTKVGGFGEHERKLNEFSREIDVRRKIYEDLANRHQLARVTGALGKAEEGERVKLIDPPFTPMAPSNLPLLLFLIGGLIGGAVLGFGLAFTAEILDTGIYRRDALEKLIGAPVLTRVPRLKLPGFSDDGKLDLDFSDLADDFTKEPSHA